jgi:hypothetical protein
MSSLQTVLNIVEKGLDGLPVPGPKAALGAASETLNALRVRVTRVHVMKSDGDRALDDGREQGYN